MVIIARKPADPRSQLAQSRPETRQRLRVLWLRPHRDRGGEGQGAPQRDALETVAG
jgi:hypothetical protein